MKLEKFFNPNGYNEIYDPNFQGIHAFFEQKIFSTKHVYFQKLPDTIQKDFQTKHLDPIKKENPIEDFYTYNYHIEKRSILKVHPNYDKKDFQENVNAALTLLNAEKIESYKINKIGLEKTDKNIVFVILIRGNLEDNNVSNPEYIINGLIADLYTPKKIDKNIKRTIEEKSRSSNQKIEAIVIKVWDLNSKEWELLLSYIARAFINKPRVKLAYIIMKSKIVVLENDTK